MIKTILFLSLLLTLAWAQTSISQRQKLINDIEAFKNVVKLFQQDIVYFNKNSTQKIAPKQVEVSEKKTSFQEAQKNFDNYVGRNETQREQLKKAAETAFNTATTAIQQLNDMLQKQRQRLTALKTLSVAMNITRNELLDRRSQL